MLILRGSFETFVVFLCICVEPQFRDKIPQLKKNNKKKKSGKREKCVKKNKIEEREREKRTEINSKR